jgi:hypothetical protein
MTLDDLWGIAAKAQTNGGDTWDERHAHLYEWQAACNAYEQASGFDICKSEDMADAIPPHKKPICKNCLQVAHKKEK